MSTHRPTSLRPLSRPAAFAFLASALIAPLVAQTATIAISCLAQLGPTSGFTLRGTSSAGVTSYVDASVNSGKTYYPKVRGLKNSRESRDFSRVRTVVAQ